MGIDVLILATFIDYRGISLVLLDTMHVLHVTYLQCKMSRGLIVDKLLIQTLHCIIQAFDLIYEPPHAI